MSDRGQLARLGDIAEFVRGITFKPDDVVPLGSQGSVPCLRTKNVQASLDLTDVWAVDGSFVKRSEQHLKSGDTLVSSANSWNLVGKCCWIPDEAANFTFGGFVSVLRAKSSAVDPRYLYRWFSSDRTQATIRSFGRQTTNISNLDLGRCLAMEVPLPPEDEQRRIAQVLDRVDFLRAKRREAIARLDDLAQSIFLSSFGDSVANPFSWRMDRLGDVSRIVRGASPRPKGDPRYFGGPIPWLMISDVTRAKGDTVSQIREGVTEAGRDKSVFLKAGTLVLTNSATVGVPKFLGVDACIHDGFLAFLDISATIEPSYLYHFFAMNRHRISSLAPEGTQKNLNTGIAKSLLIPIPPIDVQKRFKVQMAGLDEMRAKFVAHLGRLDELFCSAQHMAFQGDLWQSSRAA